MVWAGLRGAVGLSLALLVFQSGGDQRAGKQVLFVVSGLAFLTLVVNGVLSKRVLQKLGMLETSLAKHEILQKVHDRVEERTQKEYRNKCLEGDTNCENAVQYLSSLRTFQSPVTVTGDNDEVGSPRQILYVEDDDLSGTESPRKCKKEFSTLETRLRALRDQGIEPDVIKVKMLRETFYSILRAEYWELIEHGHLPRDSPATLLLLYSIDVSFLVLWFARDSCSAYFVSSLTLNALKIDGARLRVCNGRIKGRLGLHHRKSRRTDVDTFLVFHRHSPRKNRRHDTVLCVPQRTPLPHQHKKNGNAVPSLRRLCNRARVDANKTR